MKTSTLLPGMDAEQIAVVVAPKATGGGDSPRPRLGASEVHRAVVRADV
ncbi:MAG: hypothetical protein GXP29_09400 [Planctomycetes bacterium]|nr:hypothetical protein [Planctomycetota bacterium]